MPTDLPWRYRDDAYYQKGAFEVLFKVEAQDDEDDESAHTRALQQLSLALRDETGLKISSFVDVWEEDDEEGEPVTFAELVIYNKLGVTSLAKLRRFMEEHLKGDVHPRITVIDPKTDAHFKATEFTIRYLFKEFIAHQPPNDWNKLRELMNSEDRGYGELTRRANYKHRRFNMAHPDALLRTIRQIMARVENREIRAAETNMPPDPLLDDLIFHMALLDEQLSEGGPLPRSWDVRPERRADVEGWEMERGDFVDVGGQFTPLIPNYDVRKLLRRNKK